MLKTGVKTPVLVICMISIYVYTIAVALATCICMYIYTHVHILTQVVAKVESKNAALHIDKPIPIYVHTNKY